MHNCPICRDTHRVTSMSNAQLAELASSARAVTVELAGGANAIVISTTTLLLVLIFIRLIAN